MWPAQMRQWIQKTLRRPRLPEGGCPPPRLPLWWPLPPRRHQCQLHCRRHQSQPRCLRRPHRPGPRHPLSRAPHPPPGRRRRGPPAHSPPAHPPPSRAPLR